jgi:serine hydroxymethyltransferase
MKNSDMSRPLYEVDPEISNAIDNEVRRQHEGLELIASENFVGEAALEAAGGHYTMGEAPYKYMDGWQLASFLRTAFDWNAVPKRLQGRALLPLRYVIYITVVTLQR